MTKAFIFNMNGVIVDSEKPWRKYLNTIWQELVGTQIASVFRFPVGMSPESVYIEVVKHGSKTPREEFIRKFNEISSKVYEEAPLTNGIEELANFLIAKQYKLALVSSSPTSWIDTVVNRLSFKDNISCIISINDNPDLKPKPHPSCYIVALDKLGAKSGSSLCIEDSNSGIQAAKGAGIFTIGFTTHLLPDYTQHGADAYANNIYEAIKVVEEFEKKLPE